MQDSKNGNKESVYVNAGYKNRREYLESLALDYNRSKEEVFVIAELLGASEDFDGLISHLNDI